jgi:hypothetical protein
MKVLVIPEDPTHDQYILKPVVERVFKDLGCPARVTVLPDPHLGSVSQALDRQILATIMNMKRYRIMDLFLLIVDRDCDLARQDKVDARCQEATTYGRTLLGCLAIEEVEVWALALHRERLPDGWSRVRQSCHPKEEYFEPLARQMGWLESPGRSRKEAMRAIAGNWSGLKTMCSEIQQLADAVAAWLKQRAD